MKFGEILAIAEDASFVHPDGKKVPAVVHSAIYKKSSNGNDMLAVTYRVTGGANAGKGRPIRHYIMFDRDTGKQQASNLGYPARDFDLLKGLEAEEAISKVAAVVVGKPCAIDIKGDNYQGRPQNKIEWVHPAGAAQNNGPKAEAKPKPAVEPKITSKDVQPEFEDDDDETAELERQLAARKAAKQSAKAERSVPPSDLPF